MSKYKVGDIVWIKQEFVIPEAPRKIECRVLAVIAGKHGTICECEPLDTAIRAKAVKRLSRPYIRIYDTSIVQPPALGLLGEVLENGHG